MGEDIPRRTYGAIFAMFILRRRNGESGIWTPVSCWSSELDGQMFETRRRRKEDVDRCQKTGDQSERGVVR